MSDITEKSVDFRNADGILCCSVCKEEKAFFVDDLFNPGEQRLVPRSCKCERDRREEEERKNKEIERRNRAHFLREEGIKKKRFREFTFDKAEQTKSIAACKRYVEKWDKMLEENIGLIMFGEPGTGKTFASACIANALIDNCVRVHMTSFPEILNSGENKSETVKRLNANDLLIIDDLGAERSSPYANEIIQYIVDERYVANKPLIVTTNLSRQEVYERKNLEYARIYDRIMEMCISMVFTGSSMREARAKKKVEIAKELFEN